MRLFVGVGVPASARAELARRLPPHGKAARALSGLRWLPEHNWHFTLQFLGNVDDELLPALRDACAQAAAARAPFELVLSGAGAFPTRHRARVVWVGVQRGQAELAALAEALLTGTEPLGFLREQRAFQAHLTVARLKQPSDVEPLLAALDVPEIAAQVRVLTLFRSHLSSKGAEYEPLDEYTLTGA
jgi:2'-5' RNA ligase